MMLLRGTFSAPWVASYDQQNHVVIPWYAFNFGAFGDLWMDLIGIVIYLFFSFVIFGGMKLYKRLNDLTASLKLIAASVLILAGLYLAFRNGHNNFKYWSTNSHLNLDGFVKAFNSCFYFFTGFEVFTTVGRNIASARKNIGLGVIIVLIINVLSHLIIAIIFFAAFNHFVQNMNMETWNSFHNKFVVYGGTIMMIMFVITLKINLIMQDSLYGGTSLQPLAHEGFLSNRFQKLSRDNISTKASFLHMSLTILSLFIWLIIPDLIKGITLTKEYGFMCTIEQSLTYQEPFTGSSLTAASSAITIFIYAMMFAVAIKLGITKQMKLKIWEWIVVPITMLILIFVLIWHYYTLINNIVTASAENFQSALISGLIEFIFIGTAVSFVTIWYFTYYRIKYCKRVLWFPEQQAKIEQNFQVISQSKLVYEHIYQILLRYLKYYNHSNKAEDY
ncbi:amino acid permease [Spiroplasma sp. hyd1]|nr:amino acid permease [Spiroplasma sp. hyd1]MBH8622759.1 APC family permease [Spiroplasma sp. hyd1]